MADTMRFKASEDRRLKAALVLLDVYHEKVAELADKLIAEAKDSGWSQAYIYGHDINIVVENG